MTRLFIITVLGFLVIFCVEKNVVKNNKKIKTRLSDTITDIDGNKYQTIVIGKQEWMMTNLKVTHYRNGDPIPEITDDSVWSKLKTGAFCNYDNNEKHVAIYGRLYNWYAVSDHRNICPPGWHVPTIEEWQILFDYLGGDQVAGKKIKGIELKNGTKKSKDAVNKSGFTGLLGGCRHKEGPFHNMGKNGHWWSSTSTEKHKAWYCSIFDDDDAVIHKNDYKTHGFSVRCIKDQ